MSSSSRDFPERKRSGRGKYSRGPRGGVVEGMVPLYMDHREVREWTKVPGRVKEDVQGSFTDRNQENPGVDVIQK